MIAIQVGWKLFFFYICWNPSCFLLSLSITHWKKVEDPCRFFEGICFFFSERNKWISSFDCKWRSFRQIWRQLIFDRMLLFGSCWITKESWSFGRSPKKDSMNPEAVYWSCVSESYSCMILVCRVDTVKNTTDIHTSYTYIYIYLNTV